MLDVVPCEPTDETYTPVTVQQYSNGVNYIIISQLVNGIERFSFILEDTRATPVIRARSFLCYRYVDQAEHMALIARQIWLCA